MPSPSKGAGFSGILCPMDKEALQILAIVLGFGGILFALIFVVGENMLGFVLSIFVATIGGVCGIYSVDDVDLV